MVEKAASSVTFSCKGTNRIRKITSSGPDSISKALSQNTITLGRFQHMKFWGAGHRYSLHDRLYHNSTGTKRFMGSRNKSFEKINC